MDPKALAGLTVYQDLITVLEERGYTDPEVAEIFGKLTTQAEMEVVEELMGKMSEDDLTKLDSLPDNATADEIAQKMGFDGEELDTIRAEKTAALIEELVPTLNEPDEGETPV